MAGNTCKTCQHKQRQEIDKALILGEAHRSIAKRYGINHGSVYRHSRHVSKRLVKAVELKEAIWAGSVIDQMRTIYRETAEDRERLREEGNYELALRHTSVMTKLLEIQARMLGELKDNGNSVNLNGPITITVEYQNKTLVAPVTPEAVRQLTE